jgi:hypothetical protein
MARARALKRSKEKAIDDVRMDKIFGLMINPEIAEYIKYRFNESQPGDLAQRVGADADLFVQVHAAKRDAWSGAAPADTVFERAVDWQESIADKERLFLQQQTKGQPITFHYAVNDETIEFLRGYDVDNEQLMDPLDRELNLWLAENNMVFGKTDGKVYVVPTNSAADATIGTELVKPEKLRELLNSADNENSFQKYLERKGVQLSTCERAFPDKNIANVSQIEPIRDESPQSDKNLNN